MWKISKKKILTFITLENVIQVIKKNSLSTSKKKYGQFKYKIHFSHFILEVLGREFSEYGDVYKKIRDNKCIYN